MKTKLAIILAAGKGTRLSPLTDTRPKVLVPVAGKPLLQYNIERVAGAGLRDIIIVVGEFEQQVRDAFGDGSALGVRLHYVRQEEPLGTAHALRCAQPLLDGDPFVLTFGDNMTPYDLSELVAQHEQGGHVATLCLKRAKDPTKHGVAELDGHHVVHLEEKPETPKSDLTMAGMYVFEAPVLAAAERTPKSEKGEYYLPDAIQILIREGHDVGYVECTDWRTNVNTPEEMLATNRLLMEEAWTAGDPRVGSGATPPNYVAPTAVVMPGAKVGPHVSIGEGVRVGRDAVLEDCILLDGVTVGAGARLRHGVFGRGSEVAPNFQTPPDAGPTIYAGDGDHVE